MRQAKEYTGDRDSAPDPEPLAENVLQYATEQCLLSNTREDGNHGQGLYRAAGKHKRDGFLDGAGKPRQWGPIGVQ